jgi:hypothetical protein
MSLTTRDIWLEARALLDKASEVYKEKGMSAEHRAAIHKFHNFRDNIDKGLFDNLKTAQDWIRENHEYVFCNSHWTNCFGKEDALRVYHGIGIYRTSPKEGIPFSFSEVTPKDLIMGGYRYYKAQLSNEKDILSAGDVCSDRVDMLELKITEMLDNLKTLDNNLQHESQSV